MAKDLSEMTDEELDAIIQGGEKETIVILPKTAGQLGIRAPHPASVKPPVDTSYGFSGTELVLAGIGSNLSDMYHGGKEKLQLMFSPEGPAGDTLRKEIASNRQDRSRINEQLMQNPEAVFGDFLGKVITAAAAPARLPAQMALEGVSEFLKPGTTKETGIAGELANSALRGGIGAGTEGIVGHGMNGLGKLGGAMLGRFTPEGQTALRTKLAASRLGLPKTSLGQLYPGSSIDTVEKALPGYGERVVSQAKKLREVLDKPIDLPEGKVSDVGGAYVEELANAAKTRLDLGSQKYKAVDEYINANGLGAFMPQYTARTVTNVRNPGYEVASDLLTRYGFDITATRGAKAQDLAKVPLAFENFHTMRTAANKALNTLNRGIENAERMGTSIPAENRAARKYLTDLKTALDNDAEAWAAKHVDNKEALGLYKDATKYYREVVAPTVLDNYVARKATSQNRGFKNGMEGLQSATNISNIPLVDLLQPTMSRRGADMTDVLRNLGDVRSTALAKDMKAPNTGDGVGQVIRAAWGQPVAAVETAISRLPGLRSLSESNLAAKLYGAENLVEGALPTHQPVLSALQSGGLGGLRARLVPKQGVLPRSAYGLAQYPQEALDDRVRKLGSVK